MIAIDSKLLQILDRIEKYGYLAAFVGGFVRDGLRALPNDDVDIACNAPIEILDTLFKDEPGFISHPYGVAFKCDIFTVEITRMRTETYDRGSRHPHTIEWTDSFEMDSQRRDITINALYYHPLEGILDYHDGLRDLDLNAMCIIGEPIKRLQEDPLRILRIFRFQSEHGFDFDETSYRACESSIRLMNEIGPANIKKEIERYIMGVHFRESASRSPWVLGTLFSPLDACIGFDQQNPYHNLDLFNHIIAVVHRCTYDIRLRMAALFHDVGKVSVRKFDGFISHYPNHAYQSMQIAYPIFENLGYSKKDTMWMESLISHHGDHWEPIESEFQMLIYTYGMEWVETMIVLKRADNLSKSDKAAYQVGRCNQFKTIVDTIKKEKRVISLKDMDVNGNDLSALGIEKHRIGICLDLLFRAIVNGDVVNTKECLLAYCLEVLL